MDSSAYVDAIARVIGEQGRIRAAQQLQSGQIWSQLISNLGQLPLQAYEGMQKAKTAEQERQINQFKLDELKRQQAGRLVLADAIKRFTAGPRAMDERIGGFSPTGQPPALDDAGMPLTPPGGGGSSDAGMMLKPQSAGATVPPEAIAAAPQGHPMSPSDFMAALGQQKSKPLDYEAIANEVSRRGFPDLAEAWLKSAATNSENLEKLSELQRKTQIAHLQAIGDLADSSDTPQKFTAGLGLAAAHGLIDERTAHQLAAATDDGSWQNLRDEYRQFSPRFQARQAELTKVREIPEGGSVGSIAGGIMLRGTPKPPTDAQLKDERATLTAKSNLQGLSLAEQARLNALNEIANKEKGTAEQDDQRYRNIQASLLQRKPVTADDLAWAKGYEKQKTLSVDTTASAAAIRQAAAISAQIAQQGRAQGFVESQAGRKELTDKIEQPYLDAREKADTLRSVVNAARGGNMEAASVQSLLATLGLTTMEGVKRINSTELENVSGAGSLLERLKGQIGGLKSGQKLSPKLQQDLIDLAGILEKSAYDKYSAGFDRTTQRYQLKDEAKLPPSGATSAVSKTISIDDVKAVAAKKGWTYQQAKEKAEAEGFIIK